MRVDTPPDLALRLAQLREPQAPGVLLRWCAVRTYPQAERWANKNLNHIGYQTCLPLVRARRRDRAVKTMFHDVEVPLFASYLFVRHDPTSSWGPIRDAPGVRSVIRSGTQIVYTTDEAVAAVGKALETARAFAGVAASKRRWAPGTPCSPAAGPFAGHPGVVLQVGKQQALISLMLFGALREVMIRLDELVERDA